MSDTIRNETQNVEITPYVAKTTRTPSLTQVVNVSLSGLAHIQNIGSVSYQIEVEFIIHKDNDSILFDAWHKGDLIKVVDDDNTYYGYIIGLQLSPDYAEGFHAGAILIQEERVG